MTSEALVSYAQNGEDVVLLRALGHIEQGRYVDVGANHPVVDSITYAFYERGWQGITIDPMHEQAERHQNTRPRDHFIEAAISHGEGPAQLHQIDDTGLSSLIDTVADEHRTAGWEVHEVEVPLRRLDDVLEEVGWEDVDVHFVVIDTEGSERAVLETFDLQRWRPWVLVIESTAPNSTTQTHQSWEPGVLAAGYQFCLFDGLSRFYVSSDHDELREALSYPASTHDNFQTREFRERADHTDRIQADLDRARADAEGLRSDLAARHAEIDGLRAELERAAHEREAAQAEVTRLVSIEVDRDALAQELDRVVRPQLDDSLRREGAAVGAAVRWRRVAVDGWASSSAVSSADREELLFLREHAHALFTELNAVQRTVSWRVTRPLRTVRRLTPGRN